MDYEIMVSSLQGKESEFEGLVTSSSSFADEGISNLNSMSGTEIGNLYSQIESSFQRLKNGYLNCQNWFASYLSDLNSLESSLASFSSNHIDAPVVFSGEFVDLFGKKVIPTLKSGGDKEANVDLGKKGMNNQALIDAIISEDGKTIADYSGCGFHDGQWCADFVSLMLINNGYDIPMSPVAGDGGDYGDIFKALRDRGSTVHLDIGSAQMGFSDSSEYNPNYSPQPGDVVLFNWDGDWSTDHVGFVIRDNGDGTITTIEGNTSGDAGGSCVAIKQRSRDLVYGYATPV